jgi:hypothetical protein
MIRKATQSSLKKKKQRISRALNSKFPLVLQETGAPQNIHHTYSSEGLNTMLCLDSRCDNFCTELCNGPSKAVRNKGGGL